MTDFADLGINVETENLTRGQRELRALETAGARAEDRLTGGARRINSAWAGMARAAGIAGAAIAGALSTRAFLGAADQYTTLTNGLRVLGFSAEEAAERLEMVADIAARTRSPLEATAQLYQRVSIAANEMGASQAEILRFTENVGLALAQQGGSAASASGALLQLSQAIAGGTVRAEEFNSILEGAYPIALAAARGMDEAGGSVARLRQMVIEGRVSSEEFFRAILSQSDALEDAFGQSVPTVTQAMGQLRDSFVLAVGQFDAASGASQMVASAILAISDAVRSFGGVADQAVAVMQTAFQGLIVVVTALAATQIPALIAGLSALPALFIAAGGAAGIFTSALGVMAGIVTALGGPVSVLLALIAGGAAAVFLFRDRLSELVAPTDELRVAQNTLNGAMAVFHESAAPSAAQAAITAANAYRQQAAAARDAAASELARLDAMMAAQEQMGLDPEAALLIGGQQSQAAVRLRVAQEALAEANRQADAAARQVTGTISEGMAAATEATRQVTVGVEGLGIALNNLGVPSGGGASGGGLAGESAGDRLSVLQSLLGTNDPRAEIEAWYVEATTALQEAQLIERGMLEEHNAYRLQIEQSYQDQLRALRASQLDEQLGSYQSFFGDMASALQSGGGRMLEISRAFGLAEAAISIWRGAAKALELPFPASLAAWGQVIATGARALSGIKSAKPGSAGLSSGGGASTPPQPAQRVFIDLQGDTFSRGTIEGLFSQLNQGLARGMRLDGVYTR